MHLQEKYLTIFKEIWIGNLKEIFDKTLSFQFVALKNEDPQNQLCIKFKTLMTPSKIGRMQIFASVVLENQTDKAKSVFKRMKIADTSSLGPCEPTHRFGCQGKLNQNFSFFRFSTPKKSKYVPHQQQMEYGAFFQVM